MDIIELQKNVFPQIKELLKKEPEMVSSIEKVKEGWLLQCDVLEKKAIPETFDLLKIFEFRLDNEGKITGFKQLRMIRRGDITGED